MAARPPWHNSIAIIGAGPGGLAAAKYLRAENPSWRITVYEQSANVGGVWQHDPHVPSHLQRVPLVDPNGPTGVDWLEQERHGSKLSTLSLLTPMYDELETNLPKQLMRYSDLAFPDDLQLFPGHEDVQAYLETYAAELRHLIHLSNKVVSVKPVSDGSGERWDVTSCDSTTTRNGPLSTTAYQYVIVASGHYNVPFIPSIPGLEAWNVTFPGSISHSKFFRNPRPYKGKRTIVVGNAASGTDVAHHLAQHVHQPPFLSSRSESYFAPSPENGRTISPSEICHIPQIVSFDPHSTPRSVALADGQTLSKVDNILFCTGYHYSYPFLSLPSSLPPVVTDGTRTEQTYKHIFYAPRPTLAFVGLGQKIVPFPIVEAQSAVIASVWNGRAQLPDRKGMKRWEDDTLRAAVEKKGSKEFHTLGFPEDARYLEELRSWAAGDYVQGEDGESHKGILRAGEQIVPNETPNGVQEAKIPPVWNARMYWVRSRCQQMKQAFNALGETRRNVRTMEELGFIFDGAARKEVGELYGKED